MSRSKLICPTWRMLEITTFRRTEVPLARPAAAAAAAFAAWVWAAIIWLALAIRSCAAAMRSPTGGMDFSISLACFCRSRMFLKTPIGLGLPVQLVEALRDGRVGLHTA